MSGTILLFERGRSGSERTLCISLLIRSNPQDLNSPLGIPLGYISRMFDKLELSKLPKMGDTVGSSNEDEIEYLVVRKILRRKQQQKYCYLGHLALVTDFH